MNEIIGIIIMIVLFVGGYKIAKRYKSSSYYYILIDGKQIKVDKNNEQN